MFLTLLPYISLALNLLLLLGLFIGMSRSLWQLRIRLAKCESKVESNSVLVSEGIRDMNGKLVELSEVHPGPQHDSGATLGDSLNATLRSKVLKMHRMGQSTARIAESLRVPRGEVELLVKVHQVVMQPYENSQASLRAPLAS